MDNDEAGSLNWPRKSKRVRRLFFRVVILIVLSAVSYIVFYNFSMYHNQEMEYQYTLQQSKEKEVDNPKPEYSEEEIEKLFEENRTLNMQISELMNHLNDLKNKVEELNKKNKELSDDNIALQNSLKMAASVGVKPQSYKPFNEISRGCELKRGSYAGKFLGTAYTPSKEECGNNKGITNSGKPIIPGVSIAIDNKYWPFGTVFYIKGLGYAVAMDTGSAIKGKNRFDFAVFDKKFAKTLGQKYWDVYVVKLGTGVVEELKF